MLQNEEKVSADNALSGFDKNARNDFLQAMNEYDQEVALVERLKKKPMYESQVEDFLKRGTEDKKEWATMIKASRPILEKLRAEGLIIPDPEISFSEFEKKYPEYNCIKASLLQQLTTPEYAMFRSMGKMKVFQNMPDGARVIHYQYWLNFFL